MIGIFEAVARRVSDRAGVCLARSCEESERAIKETTKLTASSFQMTRHAGGSADPRGSTVEGTFTTYGENNGPEICRRCRRVARSYRGRSLSHRSRRPVPALVRGQAGGHRHATWPICRDCSRRAGHCLSAFEGCRIAPQCCARSFCIQRRGGYPVRVRRRRQRTTGLSAVARGHPAYHYRGGLVAVSSGERFRRVAILTACLLRTERGIKVALVGST